MIYNNTKKTEPERVLSLKGLYNVRDLGGYPLQDGGQVKWGALYRSGDLYDLCPETREALEKRNLKTIVDFRDKEERDMAPDGAIKTVLHTHWLPIDTGNTLDLSRTDRKVAGETLMEELYRILADKARSQYREFFRILSNPENVPVLFHCAAGKDRTGVGAALILSALGASRELIIEDYLLSGKCLEGKYREWLSSNSYLEPMMSVRRSYIEAAFDTIDRDCGGMERYLRDELEVDTGLLREIYTDKG
jgi:protein-tyrosine phosphatase